MNLEPKVYKKRPHRKVKSGCTTCKRRKIKCDEQHPRCQNCVRYSAECVYPSDSRDGGSSMSPTPPRHRTPDSPRDDSIAAEASARSQGRADSLCMDDLSLMHQWTVSTCYGFGDEFSGDVEPWRFEIPILARRYPFLMRGLLAVSAIHLARTFPTPDLKAKYLGTAAYHQDLALPECRKAFLNVTEDNISAILAFSATATVFAFAAPQHPGSLFANGAPEWFSLRMGPNDMPAHWHAWIDSSILSQQMHRRRLLPIDPTSNPDDHYLESLQRLFVNFPEDEQSSVADYEMALHLLRQAFAHTHNPESRLGPKYGVLFWIECVPKGFIDLLGLRKPCALILLAHCCVLFKRAEHFWFFEGSAEYTLSEIRPLLGVEFQPWIEWPLQECGVGKQSSA